MIGYINISDFMTWFINQFVSIGGQAIYYIDSIQLTNNVTLLDFIITIIIIEMFLGIVLTIPTIANKQSIKAEKRARKERTKE